ncbi:MAG: hypothetical protein QM645_07390 [Asticcacaulis sp.]
MLLPCSSGYESPEPNAANSTYNITVGRGTSAAGPFTDKNGTALTAGGGNLLLQGNSLYSGPGGQQVYAPKT